MKASQHTPTTRLARALATASAMVLLASCSQNAPGVAAQVGDARITDREVDDFAQVLCSLDVNAAGGQAPKASTQQVRFRALELLIGIELARDIADFDTADKTLVARAITEAQATRNQVPASLRGVFDDLIVDYARSQLALVTLGRTLVPPQNGVVDDTAAFGAGDQARSAYARTADITVDPRFGTFTDGALTRADGSLSVPVSQRATAGASDAPPADYVSSLPASQVCG